MNLASASPVQLSALAPGSYQIITNTDATETVSYGPTSACAAGTIGPGASVTIPGSGWWVVGSGPAEITLLSVQGVLQSGGQNARGGLATLAAGTVTIADSTIDANSEIFLTVQTPGGTQGDLSVVKTPGTGFTINSSSGTDTSVVAYFIIEIS